MSKTFLNRCGFCKEFKNYPLFKVPLGPAEYEPNPAAAAVGLDVQDGVVHYSWFCLPCTRLWTKELEESFLIDGSVEDEDVESV